MNIQKEKTDERETKMTELELIEQIPDLKSRAFVRTLYESRPKDLPENPKKNTWYVYRPEGCICSEGTPYYSTMKIGSANNLMILFCGGGVALDAYSAARPSKIAPEAGQTTFYTPSCAVMGYFYGRGGIAASDRKDNPFKDWSVVIVQYASGDFHCGTNDFAYEDEELGSGVCHHHGYLNYRAMVEKIKEFVPAPDRILVTGFSAGGFGTALLTDDVMRIFPECKDVTALVDSATFSYDGWHEVAEKQWKAPKEICDRLVSDDLVLDSLLALTRQQGDRVRIAFTCTYRDALLSLCQNYADGKGMIFDQEGGDHFQAVLKHLVETLQEEVPGVSIYLFDKPHEEVEVGNLTEHTIIASPWALDYSFDGRKFIDWLQDVVCGRPSLVGLDLLNR